MLYMPPTAKAAPPAARIPAIILHPSQNLHYLIQYHFTDPVGSFFEYPYLTSFSENASKLCCRFCSDFVNKYGFSVFWSNSDRFRRFFILFPSKPLTFKCT